MQLLALALAHGIERGIVTADQANKLLRVHFMAVTAGVLMRHRFATDIGRLGRKLLRSALA